MGRRKGAAVPLSGAGGGELGPIKHDVAWAEIYLHIKWHLDLSSHFATIDMGRKVGVLCPFLGELNPQFNTMSPGLRPTSVPTSTSTI